MRESKFNKPLTVSFPDEVIQKIRDITDQQKISMGEWIRSAVSQQLKCSTITQSLTNNKE